MFLNRRREERKKAAALDRAEDETSCLFVGSKGLLKLCETHQPLPNDFSAKWPRRALQSHRSGGRVYVHATAVKHFARRALLRIDSPFVLVSGDCVADVSPASLGESVVSKVLDHPHLIRWHAQNLGFEHTKVQPMPLGLDYHTISRRRRPEWGPQASPRAQEDLLLTIRAMSPPLGQRRVLGYSNWHFVPGNGDRAKVIGVLPGASCFYEPDRVPRAESWIRNTGYLFTISPRGQGMDCHRTWEAILLGSVPVIPDLPINRLFQDLPVVVVQDWAAVTPGFLAAERERVLDAEFDFAPVLLETWKRRLFGRGDLPSLRMRYQEFMEMGPGALHAAGA
ncbi:MAG: hypothetical protein GY717_02830 [Rhodobacteraceae bacterium]|nr:hypothetical protein [Paracoccaceae bacterium]